MRLPGSSTNCPKWYKLLIENWLSYMLSEFFTFFQSFLKDFPKPKLENMPVGNLDSRLRFQPRNEQRARTNVKRFRQAHPSSCTTHPGQRSGVLCSSYRARAKLPDTKQVPKRVLREISPIGEISPVETEPSYEESSAQNRATNC